MAADHFEVSPVSKPSAKMAPLETPKVKSSPKMNFLVLDDPLALVHLEAGETGGVDDTEERERAGDIGVREADLDTIEDEADLGVAGVGAEPATYPEERPVPVHVPVNPSRSGSVSAPVGSPCGASNTP